MLTIILKLSKFNKGVDCYGSVMKVKPLGTAFVDSSHATENFSDLKKTLAGSFHETPSNLIMYKTLLTFDLSMVYFPIDLLIYVYM